MKQETPQRAKSWLPVVLMSLCIGGVANEQLEIGQTVRRWFKPSAAYAQNTATDRGKVRMVNRHLPDVATVFDEQKSKVVAVKTEMARRQNNRSLFSSNQPRVGQGSGFFVDAKGHIITNYHVVAGASKIEVNTAAGKKYKAKLIGADQKTDIALLKITPKTKIDYVKLGDSSKSRVGEWVVAIGSPFGLEYSVTTGILSAKGRNLGQGPYDDFLQTDASINPGNSGGPLFNLYGEVIGVNTAIIRDGQGIGFAVPVDIVKSILPQLKSRGYVVRGYIGAGIQKLTSDLAKSFKLPSGHGVLIGSISKNGPAEKAQLRVGDVVVKFNKRRVKTVQALLFAVAETRPGSTVPVELVRDGKTMTVQLTVVERPDSSRKKTQSLINRPGTSATGDARSVLGIEALNVDAQLASQLKLQRPGGAYVQSVLPKTPATGTLRPGDVILQVNQYKVQNTTDLNRIVKRINKTSVRMLVWRDGRSIFVALR